MLTHYFYLANVRTLLALNHALAKRPELYHIALYTTDQVADVLTLATMLLLWFWPERHDTVEMFATFRPSAQATGIAALLEQRRQTEMYRARYSRLHISRQESRAQLLVFAISAMAAYVTARLLAIAFHVDRPIATFLPLREGVEGAFEGIRLFHSFPSDHAALLGALPLAMFYWNRSLGWAWTALAALLVVTRVAVGFHYPADMLVGALIGMAVVGGAFQIYQERGKLYNGTNYAAGLFSLNNTPYCYFLYFIVVLIGLEFVMHFRHVFDLMLNLRGAFLYRFHH